MHERRGVARWKAELELAIVEGANAMIGIGASGVGVGVGGWRLAVGGWRKYMSGFRTYFSSKWMR